MPVHVGNGIVLGELGGETTHTLNISELPAHNHVPNANGTGADQGAPGNNFFGNGSQPAYAATANSSLVPATVLPIGGSQPHENMPPYLVVNFIIALQGIFPSQN